MRPANLAELARDPVGRCVYGDTWAHYCVAPGLWGVCLWGRPTETEAVQLGRSLILELSAPARPHASIIDASRMEGGDEGAFGALERYVEKHWDALKIWVEKL